MRMLFGGFCIAFLLAALWLHAWIFAGIMAIAAILLFVHIGWNSHPDWLWFDSDDGGLFDSGDSSGGWFGDSSDCGDGGGGDGGGCSD